MDPIQDFLAQPRFAFIGVSRHSKDFSRMLFREFRSRGYAPIPVHPVAREIEGIPCARSLKDIDPPVDSVLLMTSPSATEDLVRECVDCGVRRVWFYRGAGNGAGSPAAVKYCQENGMAVIPGECPFMFFEGTGWIHRFHGFVRKITSLRWQSPRKL